MTPQEFDKKLTALGGILVAHATVEKTTRDSCTLRFLPKSARERFTVTLAELTEAAPQSNGAAAVMPEAKP